MGGAVPAILFFLLSLDSFSEFFTIAATCFLSWGIADLAANVVARPRLEKRTATQAIREWENSRAGTTEKETDTSARDPH
ncbi:MAG TPA: hypothetical protein VMS12_12470 [Thermoanaerobaculia bacterium]|nr:hypothetical protein [Thermoanaerobaculia bacterium]